MLLPRNYSWSRLTSGNHPHALGVAALRAQQLRPVAGATGLLPARSQCRTAWPAVAAARCVHRDLNTRTKFVYLAHCETVANAEHVSSAKRMKADGHTAKDIAKYLGVSRATLYRYLADEAAQPTFAHGIRRHGLHNATCVSAADPD
jgi:DNA-binding phage protein